ncbi:MAG: hypothetical protein KGL52_14180, partial [Rhodospirillales bacterium]|nr:hypothetical protein [Rhodospirillales bacterium]
VQIIEIAEKSRRLEQLPLVLWRLVHVVPPKVNRGSASIQRFRRLSRTPSPDCPAQATFCLESSGLSS